MRKNNTTKTISSIITDIINEKDTDKQYGMKIEIGKHLSEKMGLPYQPIRYVIFNSTLENLFDALDEYCKRRGYNIMDETYLI